MDVVYAGVLSLEQGAELLEPVAATLNKRLATNIQVVAKGDIRANDAACDVLW